MMRRFLLTIILTASSIWSQAAPQQAQPPIVVKVEMPPESVWTTLLKLAIPTILGAGLGAGLTLYGVRQTNKHNASENTANREHQLRVEIAKADIAARYKSQDRRWEFRKEVYVNLLNATSDLADNYSQSSSFPHPLSDGTSDEIALRFQSLSSQYGEAVRRFLRLSDVAPLALADEVAPLVSATISQIKTRIDWQSQEAKTQCEAKARTMLQLVKELQTAGRKDLWGTPEAEAKADTAQGS
jgi:hypothetical protein